MAAIVREQKCEWIENYLKLWDKLQKNMEIFTYFRDKTRIDN